MLREFVVCSRGFQVSTFCRLVNYSERLDSKLNVPTLAVILLGTITYPNSTGESPTEIKIALVNLMPLAKQEPVANFEAFADSA